MGDSPHTTQSSTNDLFFLVNFVLRMDCPAHRVVIGVPLVELERELVSRPCPAEGTGLPRHYVQLLAPDPTWMCNGRSARWKVAHLEGGKCSSRGRDKGLFSVSPFTPMTWYHVEAYLFKLPYEVVSIICSLALPIARQRCYRPVGGYSQLKVNAWP